MMNRDSELIEWFNYVDPRIDIDESNLTPIQEFYKDTKIFVTGGTGFLGQILTEKLLRSCPVSTLYLLVRPKKGKDVATRVKDLFEDECFSRLKKTCPNFLQKVVAIEGDCALPDLGLSDQDKKLIKDEVNIVFHVAATIRFDEQLKKAAILNIRAIRDLSKLAQQMSKLKSFVHVSTAYSNCIRDVIEEKVYPTPMDYNTILEVTEDLDDNILNVLTPILLGKYPNTYIFTKQIAEDVVKRETRGLAVGIYRPAIVSSTSKEPCKGWTNSVNGHPAIAVGIGMGLIRTLYCDENCLANLVPADLCVNGLIASAWDVAEKFRQAKIEHREAELPIYNYENTTDQPITWRRTYTLSTNGNSRTPCFKSIWVPHLYYATSLKMYLFLTFLLHIIPAIIVDTILFCIRKETMLLKAYRKINYFTVIVGYFLSQNFHFKSLNVRKMLSLMSDKDRDVFFCDLKAVDWAEFFNCHAAGCRVYLVKDPIETLPQARVHFNRLIWADRALKAVLGLLAITVLWFIMSATYNVLFNKTVVSF